MKTVETRLLVLKNCADCPNIKTERTPRSGYAMDYICKITGSVVMGYIEWPSEMRKDGDFPKDCPLPKGKPIEVKRARQTRETKSDDCADCGKPLTARDIRLYQEESGTKDLPRCCEDCADQPNP